MSIIKAYNGKIEAENRKESMKLNLIYIIYNSLKSNFEER
jgi:hypothetical protein